jgi:hypothetical protein
MGMDIFIRKNTWIDKSSTIMDREKNSIDIIHSRSPFFSELVLDLRGWEIGQHIVDEYGETDFEIDGVEFFEDLVENFEEELKKQGHLETIKEIISCYQIDGWYDCSLSY